MERKSAKRAVAIIAAMCVFGTSCLLCGCTRDKYYEYIVDYMEEISPVCTDYILVDGDDPNYAGKFIGGSTAESTTIIYNDVEINVSTKRTGNFEWELTIDNNAITIDKAFMAERSKEYVTITEMWFRYYDDMENYHDTYYCNIVTVFDDNIFILAYDEGFNTMMGMHFQGGFPFTLYRYDFEKDELYYVDYYIDKTDMFLSVRIVKAEKD